MTEDEFNARRQKLIDEARWRRIAEEWLAARRRPPSAGPIAADAPRDPVAPAGAEAAA